MSIPYTYNHQTTENNKFGYITFNPCQKFDRINTRFDLSTTLPALDISLKNQQTPWFTPTLKEKIEKAQRHQLTNPECAKVLQEIAELSTNFYPVKFGQCIAIKLFTGEIVETSEKELDLLKKLQGKKFDSPIFVWKVGSSSFAGWTAWRQQ
ncbi:MAG: hypothetical protein LBH62_03495 [Nitrososphaerota archaeon]|jgi:hypothetical protein|uniref:hypothetical protein n=1 Tax=Candidatus Bathycorpusculum sp. TaxID=2994959 RepID=UPI00281B2D45|nr:hypothetical protein [Candidatus Termiticorpusculum sp.]MCL2257440.1 hypothetical protein [Candidatus Termiticorpusculum sp.]MCL2292457.1 hypothetical protein [Candidatus Termiticorpusculum sp.]MDR0460489.1 hypothetical protein [Nitrososphaerota archaeon]